MPGQHVPAHCQCIPGGSHGGISGIYRHRQQNQWRDLLRSMRTGPYRKINIYQAVYGAFGAPAITNEHDRQRAVDELPQSADGKTIMTTEPKFIPKGSRRGPPYGR